jgi:hypothetical protein
MNTISLQPGSIYPGTPGHLVPAHCIHSFLAKLTQLIFIHFFARYQFFIRRIVHLPILSQ